MNHNVHWSLDTLQIYQEQKGLTQARLTWVKPFCRCIKGKDIVGKEENAGNQHLLLFPQCFLSYERQLIHFE